MKVPQFFRKTHSMKESSSEVRMGAFGGTPARVFPTNVNSVFTALPGNPSSGISARIAARPNSAPMLDSADFHTQIPGLSMLKGMAVVGFLRGSDSISPAAVTDATHLTHKIGIHPTTRRKVLRGDGSL